MKKQFMQIYPWTSVLLVMLFLGIQSCEINEKFDEHYKNNYAQTSDKTVLEELASHADYSSFYNAILETGLDSLLNLNFPKTVFAPPNEVFDTVKDQFTKDSLKIFLEFHITYGSYLTADIEDVRLRMANDKYINISNASGEFKLDNIATLSDETFDIVCKNGILQGIDRTLILRLNLYEYLYLNFPLIKNYFDSQTDWIVDYDKSIPTGEFDDYGRSILDTFFIIQNHFLEDIVDLTAPDVEYTVIIPPGDIVEDIIAEDVTTFFGHPDSIPDYVKNSIIDDIFGRSIFTGNYTYDNLPDQLLSIFNRFIPINKAAIAESDITLNNGVLHTTYDLTLNQSSYLLPTEVQIFEGMRDQTLNYAVSDESLRLRVVEGQNIFMYYSENIGDWIEFETDPLLISEYEVWFCPGSSYKSSILTIEVDGQQIGDPFDYKPIGLNEELIGTISFDSLGKHTVRITLFDYGEDEADITMRLSHVKLVPIG